MDADRSPLIAFRVAETLEATTRVGHYDAVEQLWVGDAVVAQNSNGTATTTVTFDPASPSGATTDSDSD